MVETLSKHQHIATSSQISCQSHSSSISSMFQKSRMKRLCTGSVISISTYHTGLEKTTFLSMLYQDVTIWNNELYEIHNHLCHLGIMWLYHYCRSHNLLYSVQEIRQLVNSCSICQELKPTFFKPPKGTLIQATSPWEGISIDFVGLMANSKANQYLLTIVDKFSHFPFAYLCANMKTETVIEKLMELFTIFRCLGVLHSNRSVQFESGLFRHFLMDNRIVKSGTMPYQPQANSQCETMNRVLCKAISLSLWVKGLTKLIG